MRRDQRIEDNRAQGSIFRLKIKYVKMKVKFQCKMKIECNNEIIASEIGVGPEPNIYNFNQDVVLTQNHADEHNTFILSFYLVTSKGTKYIAALAHLFCSQLTQTSQGHPEKRLVINLSKCLDPDAIIQILVKEVTHTGIKKHLRTVNRNLSKDSHRNSHNSFGNSRAFNEAKEVSVVERGNIQYPSRFPPKNQQLGSKSEVFHSKMKNFYRSDPKKLVIRDVETHRDSRSPRNNMNRSKSRSIDVTKKYEKSLSKSKASLVGVRKGLAFRTQEDFHYPQEQPDNVLIRSAYIQSNNKLRKKIQNIPSTTQKQDDKFQTEYQNNYIKLQKLKYAMLNQQLQKNIVQKNNLLQKSQQRILQLQYKIRHLSTPVIQTVSQDTTLISSLQQKIAKANQELEQLRIKISRINRQHSEKQKQLLKQLDNKNHQLDRLQQRLTKIDTQRSNSLLNLQTVDQEINKKSNAIFELQLKCTRKQELLGEKEKIIGALNEENNVKANKIQELMRKIANLQTNKVKSDQAYQTLKNKQNATEISSSNLNKIIEKLEHQLTEARKFKDKYNEKVLQVKKYEGDIARIVKNYQNNMQTSTNKYNTLQQKYREEANTAARAIKQLQQKCMTSKSTIKQLQNKINFNLKHEIQNYKKQNQRIQREYEQLRLSQRSLTKQSHLLQGKVNSLSGQLQLYKNKCRSLQTQIRVQNERFNAQNRRLKQQMQQEAMRNMSQRERQSKLTSDNSILTNKLSIIQQTHQRQLKSLTDKIDTLQKTNKKNEQQYKKQQQLSRQTKQKQRQLIGKLRQFSSSQSQYTDIIKNYEQQLNSIKQQSRNTDSQLKSIKSQYQKIQSQLKQTNDKYQDYYHKYQQLTYQYKEIQNQCHQLSKINQQYLYEIQSLKNTLATKQKIIQKNKLYSEQQNKQKSVLKQQLLKAELLQDNQNRENQRFHQYLFDTINRELSTIENDVKYLQLMHNNVNNVNNANNVNDSIREQGQSVMRTKQLFRSRGSRNGNTSPRNAGSNRQQSHSNILNLLNNYSKQAKQCLNKWQTDYKNLQNTNIHLQQQLTSIKQNLRHTQQKNNHIIQKLQKQLLQTNQQSITNENKASNYIKSLQNQLQQLTSSLDSMKIQHQELTFTLNGTIMEKDSDKQYYEKTINQKQTVIQKLQENIQNMYVKCQQLEQNQVRLQKQLTISQEEVKKIKEDNKNKRGVIKKLECQVDANEKVIAEVKEKNKGYLVQISQLELLLANQKERMSNNMQLLHEDGKKLIENKQFINNLIKQKEAIVRQEINNAQKIIQLESTTAQQTAKITELQQNLSKITGELGHQKHENKKIMATNKQLQLEIVSLQDKSNKLQDKIKDRQRKITLLQQNYANLQAQIISKMQSKNKDSLQKSDDFQMKIRILQQELTSYKTQINRLQEQVILKLTEQLKYTNYALETSNKQLQRYKKINTECEYQIENYKENQEKLLTVRRQLQGNIENLQYEIREKDQKIYAIEGELGALEHRNKQIMLNNKREIQALQENYEDKQEILCDDYQSKLEEYEKQNKYLKTKVEMDQTELKRVNQKFQQLERQSNSERKVLQDRIMKFEQEKSSAILHLKNQLKKVETLNQNKQQELIKKIREIQSIKNTNKSEKYSIIKLEQKIRQYETQISSLKISLNERMQAQKQKDLNIKKIQEQFKNYQWGLQREIRKIMQGITKGVIDICGDGDTPHRRKFIESIREAQNNIVRALSSENN